MSKITISLLLICCLSAAVTLHAQGRPAAGAQAEFILFELIPVSDTGYISILTDNEERPTTARLVFTGANEEIKTIQEISLIRRGLAAQLEGAFMWNGQLTIISSMFYPGPQRDLLFIRRYRLPDLTEIDSEMITEAYVPGRLRVPFGYSLSPDKTKVMFYSWTYAMPKDPVKMEIHVLDQKLERLWDKRFLLPSKNANFYIYGCQVDNEGNTYLLCEDYKGKVGPGVRIQDKKIERFVLRFSAQSDEATSFSIQLPDKVITDVKFTMDKAGNLLGGGLYREGNKLNHAGLFAYRIDQATQGYRKWEFPIDKDEYQTLHPYSEDGKFVSGTRQFRNYYIDQLSWDESRGLTLIGEQRQYEENQSRGAEPRLYEHEDKFNDILVMQLDTEMKKQWATRIPKRQSALWTEPNFVSYRFLERGSKQYVLFNDELANFPQADNVPGKLKELDFTPDQPNGLIIHMVQIGPNGKLLHQNMSEVLGIDSGQALVPTFTRSNDKDVFLLYTKALLRPDLMGRVYPITWIRNEE
jgi:hypothetical protein